MSEINMFEKATKEKLRFQTSHGLLSAEELWDLPLQHASKANLDDLAQALEREVQTAGATKSFVKPEIKKDPLAQLRFDIVLRIIEVKVQERDAKQQAAQLAQEKQTLMALLDRKKGEALENMTPDEIEARLAEVRARIAAI